MSMFKNDGIQTVNIYSVNQDLSFFKFDQQIYDAMTKYGINNAFRIEYIHTMNKKVVYFVRDLIHHAFLIIEKPKQRFKTDSII
jgi:hypothetical protein